MGKAPKVRHDLPAIARVLDERVEDLRGLARRALRNWDSEAIHHARVGTRRLKAALDVLRPLLPNEARGEFAKSLRKLRKALGPLRDLDVMLVHLEELRVPASCAAGAAWVTQRLLERRGELRRRSARRLSPRGAVGRLEAWVDLEHDVADAQAAAGPLLARVTPTQVRAFAARADGVVAAATPTAMHPAPDAPSASGTPPPAEDVHGLRVAGKLLRYTLELAEPLGFDVPGSVSKELKKLQDALGIWHDFVVLTNEMLALAIDAGLAATQPHLFGEILTLARLCWDKSEQSLNRFRKLWAERGAALVERVSAVFAESPSAPATEGNGAAHAGGQDGRDPPESDTSEVPSAEIA